MDHVLADGTQVRIRPIRPADKPRLAAGMARVSTESLRRRFLTAKPSLSEAELRYFTEVDGVRHLALVAMLADDPEQIVAVARCIRAEPDATSAEFAIIVADPLQRRGLGAALMGELAAAARAVGIRRFNATTLAGNHAVLSLVESISPRVSQTATHSGVHEIVAELPPVAGESAGADSLASSLREHREEGPSKHGGESAGADSLASSLREHREVAV